MNFLFPENIEEFHRTNNIAHLEELIRNENQNLSSNIKYRSSIRKQKYIYSRCKFKNCSAYLTYHINEEEHFVLSKYCNSHNHTSLGTRASLYKAIEDEINDLPMSMTISTAKHLLTTKYKINESCFYYLFRKVKNRKICFL